VNARVNRALGGGYEEGYDNCELEFLDIQNIHVIRDSLKKIRSACYPHKNPKNNKKIADSQWLVPYFSIK
jgi:myotubularin-related protein 1/2